MALLLLNLLKEGFNMGEILVRREGKKMELDNNKMTSLTCGTTYRPDNTACLNCGETAKTFGTVQKMPGDMDNDH